MHWQLVQAALEGRVNSNHIASEIFFIEVCSSSRLHDALEGS